MSEPASVTAPDKEPAVRLRMHEEAGELRIPFTTGMLLGIGENLEERVDTLLAIRDRVGPQLEEHARSAALSAPEAASLERVLTRFRPIVAW